MKQQEKELIVESKKAADMISSAGGRLRVGGTQSRATMHNSTTAGQPRCPSVFRPDGATCKSKGVLRGRGLFLQAMGACFFLDESAIVVTVPEVARFEKMRASTRSNWQQRQAPAPREATQTQTLQMQSQLDSGDVAEATAAAAAPPMADG